MLHHFHGLKQVEAVASDSEGEVDVAAPAGDEGNHDERWQLNTISVIMREKRIH